MITCALKDLAVVSLFSCECCWRLLCAEVDGAGGKKVVGAVMQRTGWWPPTTHAVAVAVASDAPSLLSFRFGDPRVTFAFVFSPTNSRHENKNRMMKCCESGTFTASVWHNAARAAT